MISRVRGRINITQLLLSGAALSMIMDALTRIITLSAPNALGLHNVTYWLSGVWREPSGAIDPSPAGDHRLHDCAAG